MTTDAENINHSKPPNAALPTCDSQDEFPEILEYLKEQCGIDFSAYKTGSIRRRLEIRLSRTGMENFSAYLQYLREHPAEPDLLLETIAINVSRFFRNSFVFEGLADQVIPALLAENRNRELRIWCAGCGRGEEVYSLAMLITEIMSRQEATVPVFIIGTDIDRGALAHAEKAFYRNDELAGVTRGYLDRHFTAVKGGYRLRNEIRSMVTFAFHDVTTCRPPKEGIFSDYHLVLCRNFLIYLKRESSEKILEFLAANLRNSGYLVLGEAEAIPARLKTDFHEVIPRSRIFYKEAVKC